MKRYLSNQHTGYGHFDKKGSNWLKKIFLVLLQDALYLTEFCSNEEYVYLSN